MTKIANLPIGGNRLRDVRFPRGQT
jgi:hypothetical protein